MENSKSRLSTFFSTSNNAKGHSDYLNIAAYELDQIHWQGWDFGS